MAIKPFRIAIDSADIADLKRRLDESRWAIPIPNSGWRLGIDTEFLRSLTNYWRHRFEWRAVEVELNELPQFTVDTTSGPIHFVHLRGSGPRAIPIVLTHGWPSTFAEFAKLARMLASADAFGASDAPSFDVVIPSLPGYLFSPAPLSLGTIASIGKVGSDRCGLPTVNASKCRSPWFTFPRSCPSRDDAT